MSQKAFSLHNFLIRFVLALVLVFASINPSGYSWFHWFMESANKFDPLLILGLIVLLIGWAIYIRATIRSLGVIGTLLALAFFGALIWSLVHYEVLSLDNTIALEYVVLVMLAAIMATGISWSHVRRRMTGQVDVDEVSED